jgi:hypothetical protein
MGARESRSQQEAADDDGSTPQDGDYYTILELDENASADEIRVSSLSLSSFTGKNGAGDRDPRPVP